jgi:hypothetical protein
MKLNFQTKPFNPNNTPTMKLNFQTKSFNPNLFSCSSSPIVFVFSEIELNFHTNKQSLTHQIDIAEEEKFDASFEL